MFGTRFGSSIGLLGIDVGTLAIRMLQLREHSREIEVVGAAEVEGTCDEAEGQEGGSLAERIRASFGAGGFTGRRCVVSLPRADVHIQSLRMPKMPDHELREAAAWEASQRFGFDRSAMEVDILRTGATLQKGGENREEVLIIAAPHARIYARLQPILDAGLRPIAVDTDFAALARVFSRQYRRESDRQHVRAVIEVGATGSTVIILRGDQITFCKPVEIGGEQFNEAVAEHLQMDVDAARELRASRIAEHAGQISGGNVTDDATDRAVFEAVRPHLGELAKEITLCLRYYNVTFRGRPPVQMILTGGDGLEPKLDEMIEQACKVPIAHDDELGTQTGLVHPIREALNRTTGPAGSWAVAAGLSMRSLTVGKRRSIWGSSSSTQEETPARRGAA